MVIKKDKIRIIDLWSESQFHLSSVQWNQNNRKQNNNENGQNSKCDKHFYVNCFEVKITLSFWLEKII